MADAVAEISDPVQDHWAWLGGEAGPLAGRVGPAQEFADGSRLQRFVNGEIIWSAPQEMAVSAYRLRDYVRLDWRLADWSRLHYRWWQINAFRGNDRIGFGGSRQGRSERSGHLQTRVLRFGRYDFEIRGCDDPDGDRCRQGWTRRVGFVVGPRVDPVATDPPVDGLIAERWHIFDAWQGPLGHPKTAAASSSGGGAVQIFEGGSISVAETYGPMVTASFQAGRAIVVNWGPARESTGLTYDQFNLEAFFDGSSVFTCDVPDVIDGWVDPGCGQHQFMPEESPKPLDGLWQFWIRPGAGWLGPGVYMSAALPATTVWFQRARDGFPFDGVSVDPIATGGRAARASVRDVERITSVVATLAGTRPLIPGALTAGGENLGSILVARLEAVKQDPGHTNHGELPSRLLVNEAILSLNAGIVGTSTEEDEVYGVVFQCHRLAGEYDTLLKHLIAIAYRYPAQLQPRTYDHLVSALLSIRGPHDDRYQYKRVVCDWSVPVLPVLSPLFPAIPHAVLDIVLLTDPIAIPESENHLLMIESARYLTNALLYQSTGNVDYNNKTNGMTNWLLSYMADIARFDFLEFNARPYTRYSVNALLNLDEFATDPPVQEAAHLILDYMMAKFAISSNNLRRIGPFRRLPGNINRTTPPFNDFYGVRSDPLTGLFHQYGGPPNDASGTPKGHIPGHWIQEALLAGLAPYRPPAAAYDLALNRDGKAFQHRLYHGNRPPALHSLQPGETINGGVEIYFQSRSFTLTAGGMFLNSGYGIDELQGYAQCAIAQATTLLPTQGDLRFEDLIRFEPWPDARQANNTAVHQGFAAGAQFVIPERWSRPPGTPADSPWYLLNLHHHDVPLGVYVAAYRTRYQLPGTTSDPTDPGLVTMPGDIAPKLMLMPATDIGFFYAIESAAVPSFQEFCHRALTRNPQLPKQLELGSIYEFNTPDDHHFTFEINPTSAPYRTRIRYFDGHPLAELTAVLPAEGPHLTSTGNGRDGRYTLNFRGDPAASLLLDFSDRSRPTRTDHSATAQPWLNELAREYTAYADDLWAIGRPADAQASLKNTVASLDQLAQTDPSRVPDLAAALVNLAGRRAPGQLLEPAAAGERSIQVWQQLAGVTDHDYPTLTNLTGLNPQGPAHSLAEAWYYLGYVYWDVYRELIATPQADAAAIRSRGTLIVDAFSRRLEVARRLALNNPGAFTPLLQAALADLAGVPT